MRIAAQGTARPLLPATLDGGDGPLAQPRWARAASLAVLILGVLVLFGWVFGVQRLKSVLPGAVSMKANAALGLLLLGIALLADPGQRIRAAVRRLSTVVVIAIGLATLIEYTGVDLGIDQLIARDGPAVGTLAPGRMSPGAAVCFVALGLALVIIPARRARATQLADVLVLLSGGIAFIALAGYAYGVTDLYGFGESTKIAIHTAVGIELAAAAVFAANRATGAFALLDSPSDGGVIARRLVPVVALIPVGLGWLVLNGHRLGYFGVEFAIALFALLVTVTLGTVAWSIATSLDRMHVAHGEAERRSTADQLTGLLNRRGLDVGVQATHAHAQRYGRRYAIVVADLDGLKKVNDRAGHGAGDKVLRAFAAALRSATRDADVLARIGGDEFVAVLIDSDACGVGVVERKLKAMFQETLRGIGISDAGVSIGAAVYPDDGAGPEELLAVADSRMYVDKLPEPSKTA